MGQTSLVYTAIPDPTHPGPGLCVAVAISPRLVSGLPETQLAEFPEMLDWPARLAGMPFDVEIGNLTVSTTVAPPRRDATEHLDPALYRKIFPADCLVRTWQFVDGRSRTLNAFPAKAVEERITDLYRAVVASGTALPRVLDVGDLADCPSDEANPYAGYCNVTGYTPNAVDRMLLDYEAAAAALVDPQLVAGLTPPQRTLHDALAFYRRESALDAPTLPRFDAHDRAALLADHPTLLRRCGLAFDLVLPLDVGAIPSAGEVRIRPRWRGPMNPLDLCPRTFYDTSGGRFRAASWGTMVSNGYLALEQPQFSVVQLDCDGGLIGLASALASMRTMIADPHSTPVHEQALPALHSGGVSLVHRDRDAWLAERFQKQFAFWTDPDLALLGADDLIRGWRIDVQAGPAGSPWRSLCRRYGEVKDSTSQVTLVPIPYEFDEEGYVKAASGTSQRTRPQDFYLHEKVAGWSGWSVVTPLPTTQSLEFVPASGPAGSQIPAHERLIGPRNDPGPMPIDAIYHATPGTLPRLRFGEMYRLRARAVDLAGGSLPVGDLDGSHATQSFRYQRYTPVPPPVIVQRTRSAPAESVEHMVVCTDIASTHSYTVTRNERHILAPKCSLEMWERHGMFERVPATTPEERYHIAARERGTLLETFIHNRDGSDETITERELCNPPTAILPTAPFPARGEPLEPGQYVIGKNDRMRLPWLPDVAAFGLALWDKRNPGVVIRRRFHPRPGAPAADAAFDLDSLLLVLIAGAPGSAPVIHTGSESDREIRVELPPGDRLELCYASIPSEEWLGSLAMWNLLTDADRAALGPEIRNGQHWMITPHRTLMMSHAAQRPPVQPSFATAITLDRLAGEGRAKVTASIAAHGHSTSHVDVRARWAEVADDSQLGATETIAECDVLRVPFAYDDTVVPVARSVEIIERRPRLTNFGPLLSIIRRTEGTDTYYELTDCKRRIVTCTPVATTCWQEYLPLDVIADRPDTQPSNLVTAGAPHEPISIPASIRPAPPQVAQILPAFRRTGSAAARTRRGNALRIYLERPWFSSGVGERLAILVERAPVLPPQPTPPDWLEKVSRWAADAVWSRPAPNPQPLSPDCFVIDPNDGVPAFGGLRGRARVEIVRDIGGAPVDAIVVVPQFSTERQQWYCDLELTGNTYFPFLSLALARYQDHAVGTLGLSEVVRAELVQLAPDRSASITLNANRRKATVRVRGVSAGNRHEPQHTAAPGGGHRVRAHLEVPGTAVADLDWNARVPIELAAAWANADEVEWSGIVPVPATGAWRIVIEESEVYAGDDRGTGTTSAERITYVEILTPS